LVERADMANYGDVVIDILTQNGKIEYAIRKKKGVVSVNAFK